MWIWDVPSPTQPFSSCSDKTLSSLPGLPVHKKYYSFILNDTSDQFRVGLCHKPDWNKTNKKIFNYLLLPQPSNPWVIDLSPSHSLTASSRPKLQWQNIIPNIICLGYLCINIIIHWSLSLSLSLFVSKRDILLLHSVQKTKFGKIASSFRLRREQTHSPSMNPAYVGF